MRAQVAAQNRGADHLGRRVNVPIVRQSTVRMIVGVRLIPHLGRTPGSIRAHGREPEPLLALSKEGLAKLSEHRSRRTFIMTTEIANPNRLAPLQTPTTLPANSVRDIAGELTLLLADVFALYIKTKNFHWHMSGPHFRDYHLLLDEQGDQIFAMTDDIAERARKIGGVTLRSVGQISRSQRILDNDAEFVTPDDMLAELRDDNKQLASFMRRTHELCDEVGDVATTSLLENWIDQTERRTWFLFEATRRA
jgi:starvation-inducible DNA-binding protein